MYGHLSLVLALTAPRNLLSRVGKYGVVPAFITYLLERKEYYRIIDKAG
jgi:hypothetical protein